MHACPPRGVPGVHYLIALNEISFKEMSRHRSQQKGGSSGKDGAVLLGVELRTNATSPGDEEEKEEEEGKKGEGVGDGVRIRTSEDLAEYLAMCSNQSPIMEGYACKDVSKPTIFGRFRRRYFILYRGVLLYYNHRSQYEADKRKSFVSCLSA